MEDPRLTLIEKIYVMEGKYYYCFGNRRNMRLNSKWYKIYEIAKVNRGMGFIYEIYFSNGVSYIGKTKNLISRMSSHCYNILKKKHNKKMLDAYKDSGELPRFRVLDVVPMEEIDRYERFHILNKKNQGIKLANIKLI